MGRVRSTISTASTLASILLIAAGAAAQPKPPEPPRPPAPQASKDDTPLPPAIAVNDPLLAPIPPASHVLGNWREALTLMSARSGDLAISRQEIERAEGQSRQALALALPTLTATGSLTHQLIRGTIAVPFAVQSDGTVLNAAKDVPASPTALAQLTLAMPILAPRVWYGIGTADLAVKSAKLSTEDKRRTVLASVASSIVAVFTAERVAEINRLGLRSSLERLELTQRQFRLGVGTRLDVLRAEQDAAAARATLIGGDEGLRRSREALGLALGTSDAYGVSPTLSLNDIETTIRGTCAPGTVADRADVRAALSDHTIAKRGVTDASLMYMPTAQVSSTLSLSNQTLVSTKEYAWQIQGVITIPIFDGGTRYGQARIARASAEEAKIKLDSTVRFASLEAQQALRGVTVAEQARQVSEASRDIAREAARLAKRAYEKGAGTSFDLVDSAQKQRAAELDLAVKEFDLVKAKIAALLATASCNY